MRRPGSLRWVAAAVVAALGVPSRAARGEPPAPVEPSYAGKDLDWWVRELAAPETRDVATLVLRRFGPRAVPALVRALPAEGPETRKEILRLLGEGLPETAAIPTLVAVLADRDVEVRRSATGVLQRLRLKTGPRPDLAAAGIALLRDPDATIRRMALQLVRDGTQTPPETAAVVVEQCVRDLDDPDANVRSLAIQVLRELGPGAAPAVPALLALLDREAGHLRASVLSALGTAEVASPPVLEALTREVARSDSAVGAAVTALGGLADASPEGLCALVSCLQSPAPGARAQASQLLVGMSQKEPLRSLLPDLVPELTRALEAPDPDAGVVALLALAGEAARPAVPAMLAAVARVDPAVRGRFASSWGSLHPSCVGDVVAALSDASAGVREAAAQALVQLARETLAPHAAAIAAACGPEIAREGVDRAARRSILLLGARVAAQAGDAGAPFTAHAFRWIRDPRVPREEREAAVDALLRDAATQGAPAPVALGVAERWIASPDATAGDLTYFFSLLLPLVGRGAENLLVRFLDLPDAEFLPHVVQALARNDAGRNLLVDVLATAPRETRLSVVRSSFVSDTASIRPVLVRRLRDPDAEVRVEVARVLVTTSSGPPPSLADHLDLLDAVGEAIESGASVPWAFSWVRRAAEGADTDAVLAAVTRRVTGLDARTADFAEAVETLAVLDAGAWERLGREIDEGLRSDVAPVRAGALLAAATAKRDAGALVPVARGLLAHDDSLVRRTALRATALLGAGARPLAPDAARVLAETTDPVEAALAASALGATGPDSPVALERLAVAARSRDARGRPAAVQALANFGEAGVPILVDAARDPAVRRDALIALRVLGPAARGALEVLEALAQDPDPEVSTLAREALEAVRPPEAR